MRTLQYPRISEFTATMLALWVVYGLTVLAAGFTNDWSPSAALVQLPTVLEFFIGGFIAAGGVLSLVGAVPRHAMESDRWMYETIGLLLGGVGWLSVGIAAVSLSPARPLAYIVGGGMAFGAFWRVSRVLRVAKRTREINRQFSEDA